MKAIVCSSNVNTDFFNIVIGVLSEDIFVPYFFIIYLDYVLQISIDLKIGNGFTFKNPRCRWYPAETMTDADYADDLALLTNTPV